VTQLNELDYEAIENAVMETARGRWFLSEYKKRHSAETGTPALLDAINRLEKVITSISHDFPPQHAKKKIIVNPPVSAKRPVIKSVKATALQSKPVAKKSKQFFAKDEDMFADDTISTDKPVKKVAPADKPKKDSASEEKITTSRRFKVFKSSPQDNKKDQSVKTPAPKTAEVDEAAPVPDRKVPDMSMQPTTEEKDRIVVIRGAANADVDIPLVDEFADNAKTEKSKTAAT